MWTPWEQGPTSSLYSPQGLNLEQYFGNTEHFVGKQGLADLMCSNTVFVSSIVIQTICVT